MSEQVRRALAEEIRRDGPVPFDRFMEIALYGPGGFYERPPVGPEDDADFVTSPHVHEVFAALVAEAVGQVRTALGAPEPFRIVEVGAGDGTLAAGIISATAFPVAYTAVERSAGAREALAAREGIQVAAEMPTAGPAHLVVAHELCDNLPFRRFRVTPDGLREIAVDLAPDAQGDGPFIERETEPRAPIPDLADDPEPGEDHIWPTGALAFVDELAARLVGPGAAAPGYALLIDYGGLGSPGGPVHGYRAHRVVADPLADPGETDITAGVDFLLLATHAEAAGLTAFPSVTQRRALLALGLEGRLREELTKQAEHLDAGRGLEALRTYGSRSRATLLADPAALGRLRWLLLATPGLPEPHWLHEAASQETV